MPTRAYAPGSVTTVFVPRADEAGSLGVSFAIEDGVTVSVAAGADRTVMLDGDPTSFEPVERLLADLDVEATVAIEAAVPVGRGFGASGAATLGTALAVATEFDLSIGQSDLLQRAHQAELAAGTGQGDVFVQEQGGMVWNTGDGIGRLDRYDGLFYGSFAGISTPDVLGDEETLETITSAGRAALAEFAPDRPLGDWLETSWEFASRTGLVKEPVAAAVEEVQQAGGAATMAMIGETVIGTEAGGVLENETSISPEGAHLLD